MEGAGAIWWQMAGTSQSSSQVPLSRAPHWPQPFPRKGGQDPTWHRAVGTCGREGGPRRHSVSTRGALCKCDSCSGGPEHLGPCGHMWGSWPLEASAQGHCTPTCVTSSVWGALCVPPAPRTLLISQGLFSYHLPWKGPPGVLGSPSPRVCFCDGQCEGTCATRKPGSLRGGGRVRVTVSPARPRARHKVGSGKSLSGAPSSGISSSLVPRAQTWGQDDLSLFPGLAAPAGWCGLGGGPLCCSQGLGGQGVLGALLSSRTSQASSSSGLGRHQPHVSGGLS